MTNLKNIYNLLGRIDNTFHDTMLLSESLLFEAYSLSDVYQKYYSQIPENEFKQIVASDPTSGADKMGKYSKWLLQLYQNKALKLEDLYKAKEYLTVFNKFKNKIEGNSDINSYKSLPELYRVIQPFETQQTHGEQIRQIKEEGATKVYEDGTWLVVVPETEEAACYYGRGTKWCTAATESDNMFETYNSEGPLFINIDKSNGRKYQFHFESEQFMDEADSQISCPVSKTIGMTDGLLKFYYERYGNRAMFYLGFSDPYYTTEDFYQMENSDHVWCLDDQYAFFVVTSELGCRNLDYSDYQCFYQFLLKGRYAILSESGYSGFRDLLDVEDGKLLFNEILNVDDVDEIAFINAEKTLLNVAFAHSGNMVFDLNNMKFTANLGYCSNVSSVKRMHYLTGINEYPDNIVKVMVSGFDGKDNIYANWAFFDVNKNAYITKPIYKDVYAYDIYYNGKSIPMVTATTTRRGDYANEVILFYDGTIIPHSEFAQKSDMYFNKWFSSKNTTNATN